MIPRTPRSREEANAFNVICVDPPEITVKRCAFRPDLGGFVAEDARRFRRAEHGWAAA